MTSRHQRPLAPEQMFHAVSDAHGARIVALSFAHGFELFRRVRAPPPVVPLIVLSASLNSFLGHGAYALLLSSAPVRGAYMRARRWIEAGLGCFFLFASVKLATARI